MVAGLFMPVSSKAENTLSNDSIEISLLTCSPHDAIYSLYGHTAIRYKDLRTGGDWVFNYGIFNFKKPFFALRFALGKTDYELGVVPFYIFQKEYQRFGCQVNEQLLNITYEDKINIINALEENYRPENKVYRYNFLYNNCTTQSRDIIANNIHGHIVYNATDNDKQSFRDEIHRYTKEHPWAAAGNDLCLGLKADCDITPDEKQFLPENLMNDFDNAQIISGNSSKPLVKSNRIIISKQDINKSAATFFSPTLCAGIFFFITLCISLFDYKRGKTCVTWDALITLLTGLCGLILLLLFFSEHPTTSTNLQILILNPISLFFIPSVIGRKKTKYWHIYATLILVFLIGSAFQDYAEGMIIVALSLLIRCCLHTQFKTKSA